MTEGEGVRVDMAPVIVAPSARSWRLCVAGVHSKQCGRSVQGANDEDNSRPGGITGERRCGGTHGGAPCAGLVPRPPREAGGDGAGGGQTTEEIGLKGGGRRQVRQDRRLSTGCAHAGMSAPLVLRARRQRSGLMLRPVSWGGEAVVEHGGSEGPGATAQRKK